MDKTHWRTSGLAVVLAIAAAKLLLHLATASRYGYFGDELYFLACAEHLDWGYVDQPPLVAVVAWLVRHTLGTSLLAVRLPSALAGTALVVLTGLLARELGGGRFAMGLSAAASAVALTYVALSYLFTMNAFEPLFWTLCAFLLVRIVRTGDERPWLWFGLVAGIGLQNKYSMAVYGGALVVGLLLSPARRALARPWIWLGGAVAGLVFLPNVIWNVRHGWPFLELMRNLRESGRDVVLSPAEYVGHQLLIMNPATVPIWLAGLGFLLFSARGRAFRPLGWAFLVTLGTWIVTHGKNYYADQEVAVIEIRVLAPESGRLRWSDSRMSDDPPVSRGFRGRSRPEGRSSRVPPGQHLVSDFPVLSAGPTPQVSLDTWTLALQEGGSLLAKWTWAEFLALPQTTMVVDIHCVTTWSKLDTEWQGVSIDTLLTAAGLVEPPAPFLMAYCDGGYTTNVPVEDLTSGKGMIATHYDGEPLSPEHGGPARLLVPHLYFWKSAKWVRRLRFLDEDEPGFWEENGYHMYGDPWREQRYTGD
jgi:DMSO/TMAO reductase YedYZ molybdopterin-dependent catalytic subunit